MGHVPVNSTLKMIVEESSFLGRVGKQGMRVQNLMQPGAAGAWWPNYKKGRQKPLIHSLGTSADRVLHRLARRAIQDLFARHFAGGGAVSRVGFRLEFVHFSSGTS